MRTGNSIIVTPIINFHIKRPKDGKDETTLIPKRTSRSLNSYRDSEKSGKIIFFLSHLDLPTYHCTKICTPNINAVFIGVRNPYIYFEDSSDNIIKKQKLNEIISSCINDN